MNLGLRLWIYLDLRVLTHSLSWRYGCLLLHISSSAPTKPPPKGRDRYPWLYDSCLIIICSYLIINCLSIAIVTVPPLRGRLGGG